MIDVITGFTSKPTASAKLAEVLQGLDDLNGTLYIGYPIIGTPEGPVPFDALLLSREKGAVVINLVEGRDAGDFQEAQDSSVNILKSKLLQHRILTHARELQVEISVVTFAPAITRPENLSSKGYVVANVATLPKFLDKIDWETPDYFEGLVAVVQSISTVRKAKKKRDPQKKNSRGAKVQALENSIANLDSNQSAAVIETFEGVQRIRGLAGSGKTVVLALKAAYLHAWNKGWHIAVTFNTRSLKGQFERLISMFVQDLTGEEPDWDKIRIINAWGAPGTREDEGMYYLFCQKHGVQYYDFRSARAAFGSGRELLEQLCEKARSEVKEVHPIFDAILVDEAQDFSPPFLNLCYDLLRKPHRLVYAYDELQTLTNQSLPGPEELFGKDGRGHPRVTFAPPEPNKPRQDIILRTCYRNSRPVLSTAHALGFGIYRKDGGLIQMFDHKDLWTDIGYVPEDGIVEGEEVTLKRNASTSPLFLEDHSPIDDLVKFVSFASSEKQTAWLVEQIRKNIEEDELRPEDIIVIHPDPLATKAAVASARQILFEKGVNSDLAGVTTDRDIFSVIDRVTFTGIFRAKGNEAAMVYLIDAHTCCGSGRRGEVARLRNRLFTAMTRSKAWVRVLGVGKEMDRLVEEFEEIQNNDFALTFKYPTAEERAHLNILNRDMSSEEKRRIDKQGNMLLDIVDALERGDAVVEDYPDEIIGRLRKLLDKRGR